MAGFGSAGLNSPVRSVPGVTTGSSKLITQSGTYYGKRMFNVFTKPDENSAPQWRGLQTKPQPSNTPLVAVGTRSTEFVDPTDGYSIIFNEGQGLGVSYPAKGKSSEPNNFFNLQDPKNVSIPNGISLTKDAFPVSMEATAYILDKV
ncbi:hypothetical protein BGZ96_010374 [Linnemannia gamsii]|uniref:Uncharacterized protein n=1 Tax=Linnemannia gamsii TaxID=64522 RepID=A0ABQ7JW81_9FUNG|nr:hypothetical protein BGZ96_010374 [Linnemannia gamsii]